MSEPTPLEKLNAAVQKFVNQVTDEAPVVLLNGVLTWESVRYDDDGDTGHRVSYAVLPTTSMASAVGLMQLGRQQIAADVLACDPDLD